MTFDEARKAATTRYRDTWVGPGTFYVAPWGFEDALAYLVLVGAREDILEGDPDFIDTSGEVVLVDKLNGRVSTADYLDTMGRVRQMTPAGAVNPFT